MRRTARQGAASSLRFFVVVGFGVESAVVADLDFGDERKRERDLGHSGLDATAPNAGTKNRWGELKIGHDCSLRRKLNPSAASWFRWLMTRNFKPRTKFALGIATGENDNRKNHGCFEPCHRCRTPRPGTARRRPDLGQACQQGKGTAAPITGKTDDRLEKVATFDHQVTGVTVSEDDRIFVNFPRWSQDVPVSVAEVMKDGSIKPYPNDEWNAKMSEISPEDHFGFRTHALRIFLPRAGTGPIDGLCP
jgi:hypothetical protein